MAQILDGKVVRDKIAEDLKEEIAKLDQKPELVILQAGDFAESNTYIRQKIKFGEKIGAIVEHIKFAQNISRENLKSKILILNSDKSVHGIIVQLPIPNSLNKDEIIEAIAPKKDVDGQTSKNLKILIEGKDSIGPSGLQNDRGGFTGFTPATTKGILTLLDYYKIPITGQHVVIIGRSSLVGKPTALAFLNRDATVTICHSKTRNLKLETRNADILIVAAGKPKLITKDYVTKGQVVVDVGINIAADSHSRSAQSNFLAHSGSVHNSGKPESELSSRKLVGDVDFEEVSKIVAAISPVPGGCGPMTVASLFQNLLQAYKNQNA